MKEYEDNSNPESEKYLQYLLKQDIKFTEEGKVPVLFWYGVCKPKLI